MGSSYRRAAPPRVAHDSARFHESCRDNDFLLYPNLPTKDSFPLPKIVGTLCVDLCLVQLYPLLSRHSTRVLRRRDELFRVAKDRPR